VKENIVEFLKGKRFAIAGMSEKGNKFGNSIAKELKTRSYTLYPLHPTASEIGGEKCYPDLLSLPENVDGLIVCVHPDKVAPLLHQAAQAEVKNVWLQQGAQSPELEELGASLGLNVVGGKCILMYAEPVGSIHSFHRAVVKLFSKL
jgi:uncharacterized protein